MTRSPIRLFVAVLPLLVILSAAPAQGGEDPDLWMVERAPFGETVTLEGRLVPGRIEEIRIQVDTYTGPLEIESCADDRLPIDSGALLVAFNRDEIEKQIARAKVDVELAGLRFEDKARGLQMLDAGQRVSTEEAMRTAARAENDLQYYLEVDLPMRLAEAAHRLQGTRDGIEDQKEELAQLEKMYKADDLTEETEEIVLMRARRRLARSRKGLEFAETRNKRWLDTTVPRDTENRTLAVEKARIELEKAKTAAANQKRVAELELEKARMGWADLKAKLAGLQEDHAAMRVLAPEFDGGAGLVVAGSFVHGVPKGRSEARAMLAPGQRVKNGTLLMTAFSRQMAARVLVDETDVLRLGSDLVAAVTPAADKSARLLGQVTYVEQVGTNGKHEVLVRILTPDWHFVPGMKCSVEILDKHGPWALVVPASAVAHVEGESVVYVWNGSGKPATPVAIVPGEAKAGRISIDTGDLQPGQGVLLEPRPGN